MNLENKNCENKFTKMNCWKQLADKLAISSENAEEKFKNFRLFSY